MLLLTRRDGPASTSAAAAVPRAVDDRAPMDKTTRRRLKREAFLLKLESASAGLADSEAPVEPDIRVADMQVGPWEAQAEV